MVSFSFGRLVSFEPWVTLAECYKKLLEALEVIEDCAKKVNLSTKV